MSDNVRYPRGYISSSDILWKCKNGHVFIRRDNPSVCPLCGSSDIHRV